MVIPIIPAFREKNIIAQQFRMIRAKRNISQDELARETKLSRLQIGKIERGEVNPSIETLAAMAKALNVQIEFSLIENPK